MYRIHVQPLPGASFDVFVNEGRVIIGRSRSCEVTLPSSYVSRQHAALRLSEDGLEVCDLGSHNGTRLGSETIERAVRFEVGEVLRIGMFHLTVEILPDVLPEASSQISQFSGLL